MVAGPLVGGGGHIILGCGRLHFGFHAAFLFPSLWGGTPETSWMEQKGTENKQNNLLELEGPVQAVVTGCPGLCLGAIHRLFP